MCLGLLVAGLVPGSGLEGSLRREEGSKGLEGRRGFFRAPRPIQVFLTDRELHFAAVLEVGSHHSKQRPCIDARTAVLGNDHGKARVHDGTDKIGRWPCMKADGSRDHGLV